MWGLKGLEGLKGRVSPGVLEFAFAGVNGGLKLSKLCDLQGMTGNATSNLTQLQCGPKRNVRSVSTDVEGRKEWQSANEGV